MSWLVSSPAIAGSGPWVLSEGKTSIFLGTEAQRFNQLTQSSGKGANDIIDTDDGVETTLMKGVLSHGIRKGVELEVDVPWARAEANRPDGAVCASLGPTTCSRTQGLAPVSLQVKGLVLDELYGAPVSVSVAGTARLGQWTGPKRARVTNLGEGTNDVGAALAVGRSGGIGQGFWSAYVDTEYRYRLSNVADASPAVPGYEIIVQTEALAGARSWWSVGPTISWFERPQGVDVEDLLTTPELAVDIDRFARLSVRTVRIGGKLLIRSSERTTLALGAFTTTVAVNNPVVTGASIGIGLQPRTLRGED